MFVKGAKASTADRIHKNSKVNPAVLGEGCLRANGWVMEMNLSHVTRDRINTDDSQDKVLRKPENEKNKFRKNTFENNILKHDLEEFDQF